MSSPDPFGTGPGGGGNTVDPLGTAPGSNAPSTNLATIATQWVADLATAAVKPLADFVSAGVANTANQVLNTLWFAGLTLLGVFGMAVGVYLLAQETGAAPGAGQVLGASKTVAKIGGLLAL